MKFKIAETEEDRELRDQYGKEFKGYVLTIIGGCDKQGFPMKQGVLTSRRVCVLLHRGAPCFRGYGKRTKTCFGRKKR